MPVERREVLGTDRARTPRTPRPWLAWFGAAVVAVAAVVTVARGHEGDPDPSPRPSPSPSSPERPTVTGPPWGLVPATARQGGRMSLRLVFPDGSTADMSYPAALRLAELGVRPHASAYLDGGDKGAAAARGAAEGGGDESGGTEDGGTEDATEDCCLRPVFAPAPGMAWLNSGGPPETVLSGAGGARVPIVPPPAGGPMSPYLVFTFGRWHVGVQTRRDDRMGFVREEAWAANLQGTVTPEGFLVLHGTGPLRFTMPPDEGRPDRNRMSWRPHGGPQLRFGRGMMVGYSIGAYTDRVVIFERLSRCGDSGPAAGYLEVAISATACKGASMRIWAGGDPEFVRAVVRDVRVSNVRPAPR